MKPYMTPGRFRIGGYGVDLDSMTDAELASVLATATSLVNGYCAVPTSPVEYDFRGGTVTEDLEWELGHPMLPGQRRVLPRYTPIRDVGDFRIEVTNQQYLGFDAGELFVTDGAVEVTSLNMTSFGLWGAAILPQANIGLDTPNGRLTHTYGYHFEITGEELYASDAREYRSLNQWWDPATEPVVYAGGSVVPVTDYVIDEDEGTITFDTAPDPNDRITLDYAYRLPTNVSEATGLIAMQRLGERNLTRKGLYGLVELAVGEVRLRRDFPRAGVARHGVSDEVMQLLDTFKFITVRGS
jgi:hypothetical protein